MKHVFVSYVSSDSEKVVRLCDSLNKHGIETWLDRNSLQPGQRWKQAIKEAIQQGDFFLACFSSAYRDKQRTYMNEELTLAIEELRQHPANRVWFIPVLLDSSEVPDRPIGAGESLQDLHWVDLSKNWDAGIERIVKVIRPEGEGASPAFGAAIEALRYKQQAIRDYTGYPSYEFKQAQLKQVESDILALRKLRDAGPRPSTSYTARGSNHTEVSRKSNQGSKEHDPAG
jgi:hypothetical protein